VANLLPFQILQPWVDAAFKKRGIDPKEFWRDAGLPGFRFPDPNGQRFSNGAPPPAPQVLEGTPDHPGPGVPPGSPCSYTPPADGIPTPADPLPCAGLTQGPFGGNPYGANYGPPGVVSSAPNPKAPPSAPGVPAAAIPGQPPPGAPGVPVPLPSGLPGGRTVPVGPLPGPQQAAGSQGSSPSPVSGNPLLAPSLAPPDTGGG
jgi:phospholipid/cholesterol/gamma-HCH transport system substrate-binding protein